MPTGWTLERLRALPSEQIVTLYRNAAARKDEAARELASMIVENDLLIEPGGGLPHDHPLMLEIEAICGDPDAIREAEGAAEQGLPPLAGMEHRLVAALGADYGTYYTVHHAGLCIATQMLNRGWVKGAQRPMPKGHVAKSATTFHRKNG